MTSINTQLEWQTYREQELARVTPLLTRHGFALDTKQPHLGGERYLMQAVTTTHGRKLILLGTAQDGKRVVIKATTDVAGKEELRHERECRHILEQINFAYQVFHSPEELLFVEEDDCLISINTFIEQDRPFLARTLQEQFNLALKAFKAQESAHAATYEHRRLIEKTFGSHNVGDYLRMFSEFQKNICGDRTHDHDTCNTLERAKTFLDTNAETIDQYCDFLTHTDFVPHNIRIVGSDIFLLDHSSLRFGNKYEGWARFLNFMTLYNPPLEQALVDYVRINRTPEETLALKLMRIYRLGEIVRYYIGTLPKSVGDLHTLNEKRVEFWSRVLTAALSGQTISDDIRTSYMQARDALRDTEEKTRQQDLH